VRRSAQATSPQTEDWISQKFTGSKRAAAHAELARIESIHGRLVPSLIVELARSPTSALHDFFEWDDTIAAAKFRISQARDLIRHVRVNIDVGGQTPIEVRAYAAPTPGLGYVRIESALSQKELRERLLTQARLDLEAFQRRYASLTELAGIFERLDKALNKKKRKK
jgi:hypothetical protein